MSPPDESTPSPDGHKPCLPPASVPYRRALVRGKEISVYYDRQQPAVIERHQHDGDVQVMFVFEPSEYTLISFAETTSEHHNLTGPQITVIAAGMPHGCKWERDGELLVFYVVKCLWRELAKADATGVLHGESTAVAERDPVIWKLAATLRDLCDEGESPDRALIEGIAREIVRRLIARLAATAEPKKVNGPVLTPSQLRRVDDYINAHLAHDIHVADLERCLGLSSTQVTELFKNTLGLTPYDYIKQRRMFKADELLRTGEHRLRQVALMVGYRDSGYFSSEFKKWNGIAPRVVLEAARQRFRKSRRKP